MKWELISLTPSDNDHRNGWLRKYLAEKDGIRFSLFIGISKKRNQTKISFSATKPNSDQFIMSSGESSDALSLTSFAYINGKCEYCNSGNARAYMFESLLQDKLLSGIESTEDKDLILNYMKRFEVR